MTQDEIIEMAIQAGASPDENKIWLMYAEEIETFAKLVAAKEREALAQRTWVGLTDEEIAQGCKESWVAEQAWQSAVWWAEDKLKDKNT
jgi:DNA-directed RNA polymerase specialized sigma24 family protein